MVDSISLRSIYWLLGVPSLQSKLHLTDLKGDSEGLPLSSFSYLLSPCPEVQAFRANSIVRDHPKLLSNEELSIVGDSLEETQVLLTLVRSH